MDTRTESTNKIFRVIESDRWGAARISWYFSTPEKAIECYRDRLEYYKKNNYLVDEEDLIHLSQPIIEEINPKELPSAVLEIWVKTETMEGTEYDQELLFISIEECEVDTYVRMD
jgi:hypothetical protein